VFDCSYSAVLTTQRSAGLRLFFFFVNFFILFLDFIKDIATVDGRDRKGQEGKGDENREDNDGVFFFILFFYSTNNYLQVLRVQQRQRRHSPPPPRPPPPSLPLPLPPLTAHKKDPNDILSSFGS
jgi:hypothetical protein